MDSGLFADDRIGGYTEWFALFPSGAVTAKPEHYFNGGSRICSRTISSTTFELASVSMGS